jgi:hypothetical protein
MEIKKIIKILTIMLSFVFLLNTGFVYAAEYVPLAPLPGVIKDQPISLESYLGAIFKIGIGLAGVFAVLMIVIAGIQYIGGASSPSARTDARGRITNAIFGLILALVSWLILNTINPNLLNTSLNINNVNIDAPPSANTSSGRTQTPQYCITNANTGQRSCFSDTPSCNVARRNWQSAGYSVNGSCS